MELTFKSKKTKTIIVHIKAKSLSFDTQDKLWLVKTSDITNYEYLQKEYKLLKIVFN